MPTQWPIFGIIFNHNNHSFRRFFLVSSANTFRSAKLGTDSLRKGPDSPFPSERTRPHQFLGPPLPVAVPACASRSPRSGTGKTHSLDLVRQGWGCFRIASLPDMNGSNVGLKKIGHINWEIDYLPVLAEIFGADQIPIPDSR